MKIIKVLIDKKLENEEMLSRSKRRQFSYEEHLSAYFLALAYLELSDSLLIKKKVLWRKFLSSSGKGRIKYYKKLLVFKQQQNKIILQAFDKIEEEKEKNIDAFGSLYQPFTWGVSAFEFEADE